MSPENKILSIFPNQFENLPKKLASEKHSLKNYFAEHSGTKLPEKKCELLHLKIFCQVLHSPPRYDDTQKLKWSSPQLLMGISDEEIPTYYPAQVLPSAQKPSENPQTVLLRLHGHMLQQLQVLQHRPERKPGENFQQLDLQE